ncbi:MAG: hypothetical protein KKF67_00745 [Nanoarchaeota archaeon]|nr:hypothetical protein [Nanoarchaeota archaeon]
MKSEEVKIITRIIKRLEEKFPNLLKIAREEFVEFYGKEILKDEHLGQVFYRWFFTDFMLKDGKQMSCLARETLDLLEKENLILDNIEKGILGFFKILKIDDKDFYVLDLLTNKEYIVKTIDFGYSLKENCIINANLVKNFKGDYFFFGGMHLREGSTEESIKINLLEYTRDWTIEEALKHEMSVINRLKDNKDFLSLESYLEEVFDMDDDEVEEFINSDEKTQKAMLSEIISENNLLMTENYEWGDEDEQ